MNIKHFSLISTLSATLLLSACQTTTTTSGTTAMAAAYKTAIGDWEIHCTNKTYRLTALQLLDEHGKEISKHNYTATNIRPMSVMNGTITEKQFEAVCGSKL